MEAVLMAFIFYYDAFLWPFLMGYCFEGAARAYSSHMCFVNVASKLQPTRFTEVYPHHPKNIITRNLFQENSLMQCHFRIVHFDLKVQSWTGVSNINSGYCCYHPTSATIICFIWHRYTCVSKRFCEDSICAHVNKNEAQHLYLLIRI